MIDGAIENILLLKDKIALFRFITQVIGHYFAKKVEQKNDKI